MNCMNVYRLNFLPVDGVDEDVENVDDDDDVEGVEDVVERRANGCLFIHNGSQ